LGLQSDSPYFVNLSKRDDRVKSWSDFGLVSLRDDSYFQRRYHDIETIVNQAVPGTKSANDIKQSKYFQLIIIQYLGVNYFSFFESMNRFVAANTPETVFLRKRKGLAYKFIMALFVTYNVPVHEF